MELEIAGLKVRVTEERVAGNLEISIRVMQLLRERKWFIATPVPLSQEWSLVTRYEKGL